MVGVLRITATRRNPGDRTLCRVADLQSRCVADQARQRVQRTAMPARCIAAVLLTIRTIYRPVVLVDQINQPMLKCIRWFMQ